ncbi:hypothetical protein H3V53_06365 [Paraburkholderia bengalensis]|uniref:Rhamnogalacturonase A/B/Epimerase-like pectate lyase domain-containing protein n=1 Tax=Paraburkholderia bengalensis TaxID=2747562 RepID=A0ABU8IML3_9BURK
MTTINDLVVANSFSPDDKLPMWSNTNGVTRALPISVLTDGFLTQDDINQIAASSAVETFTAGVDFTPGSTLALTLEGNYVSADNIDVHFDTNFQGPENFSLLAQTLTFTSPIPMGVTRVYVSGGAVRSIGAPSDGTVKTSTLVDGSVTAPKLAPGAVTAPALAASAVVDASVAAGTKLSNRITKVYDVRDFGAVGNGIADDAAAITNADAAISSAGGGILYFPAGTFAAGSMIIRNSNVIWQGAGIGATTIQAKAGATMNWLVSTLNADALWGTGSVSGAYAFGMRDITLDGNKANGAICSGFGIYGATFSLDNIEIANCTGIGIRTEFGIPGAIPHGFESQSNLNNSLIHDCDAVGVVWGGPSDPSLVNTNIYRNQPYNMTTQVNGTGCKLVNSHIWGSAFDSRLASTGLQLNTPGNMLANCVVEGSTVTQIHLRSNGNIVYGGNLYYFSDASATVYGITIGDSAAGISSGTNVISTKIDNTKLGMINFNNSAGMNIIDVTGFCSALNGFGYTGLPNASDKVRVSLYGTGTLTNNALNKDPNLGGGGGTISVGAPDSGGTGFRVLRVPN